MTAPEPTAVEVIAEAVSNNGCGCFCTSAFPCATCTDAAEAVVAAIRAMSPQQQADLIGGEVQGGYHWGDRFYPSGADDEIDAVRIVTPWVEVPR